MKICLILDSTTYRARYLNNANIKIVSLHVMTPKGSFRENEIPIDEVKENIKNNVKMTTSQASPGDFIETYKEIEALGFTDALVVPLSSAISGTYQSANIAKNSFEGKLNIHVFKTKICSFAIENITPRILEIIEEENDINKVIDKVGFLLDNSEVGFTLGSLIHLLRGGRLSIVSALLGTVLRIKPIIEMIDGKLVNTKKPRTYSAVIEYFNQKISYYAQNYEKVYLNIIELDKREYALKINEFASNYPNVRTIITNELSPVFFVHLGLDGFGISITGENKI